MRRDCVSWRIGTRRGQGARGDQERVLGGGRADGHGTMILVFVCGAALDGILHSEL